MIVILSADGAVVRDAEDCGRLHAESELPVDGLRTALSTTGTGYLDDSGDDHVWLDVGTLRSRAQLAVDPGDTGWAGRWDAMIAYAGRSGWVSPDGRSVRAHLR